MDIRIIKFKIEKEELKELAKEFYVEMVFLIFESHTLRMNRRC